MKSWTVTVRFTVQDNNPLDAADRAAKLIYRTGRVSEVEVVDVEPELT